MSAKKILVVDDDLIHLKLMRRLLEKLGHIVVTTDSAEEAEHILKYEEDFSLILADLRMPWLDGLDFCRRAKTLKPDLKIYALSGWTHNFDMDELKEAGFDGIYEKSNIKSKLAEILNDDI